MRCICTGCTAKTSTVTESFAPNIPNLISNMDNHITDQSYKKCNHKKNKKLDTKKTSQPNAAKESVSNAINYDYQSCKNSDIEEEPQQTSKRLKTEEDVSFQDQDFYGDIVLWERPGDNVQSILDVSAAISGMALKWSYSKKEEGW